MLTIKIVSHGGFKHKCPGLVILVLRLTGAFLNGCKLNLKRKGVSYLKLNNCFIGMQIIQKGTQQRLNLSGRNANVHCEAFHTITMIFQKPPFFPCPPAELLSMLQYTLSIGKFLLYMTKAHSLFYFCLLSFPNRSQSLLRWTAQ